MPKRRTDDEVHVVMTDHYIRRQRPPGDLLAEKVETHETPATQYRGDVALYYPAQLPDTVENALALAVAQIHDGSNLKDGLPRLAALLERHRPPNPRYYADLAEGYLAAGDGVQAIRYLEEAVQRSRAPALLLTKLGSALLEARQWAKAEQVFRRALAPAPDDTMTWGMLGWVLFQQGKTAEARAALEKAVALDPELPESHTNLASLLASTGDMAGAEKELRTAVSLLPNVPEWQSNLGGLLANRDQLAEARYHFSQTVRLRPEDPAAHLDYGRLLAATGDRNGAIEHLKIALSGGDAQAKNEAQQLLQKLGR
jgi:Flp pilus assembly protein TadD